MEFTNSNGEKKMKKFETETSKESFYHQSSSKKF
jgi:hypothetical protein